MNRSISIICVTACLLALAIGATGQAHQINFSDLPLIAAPAPVPGGYNGLSWGNFWYVDPALWDGAGPGYINFLTQKDVVLIGRQLCGPLRVGCYGVVNFLGTSFQPVSAIMAAGYHANRITVRAYNNGSFVGAVNYDLGTTPQLVSFPVSWGSITEMQMQTDAADDLVLFDLSIYFRA
jgi:hypothetical protein